MKIEKLHKLMDDQLETRQYRLEEARKEGDMTRHWKLVVGAIDAALVKYLGWTEPRAKEMRVMAIVQTRETTCHRHIKQGPTQFE